MDLNKILSLYNPPNKSRYIAVIGSSDWKVPHFKNCYSGWRVRGVKSTNDMLCVKENRPLKELSEALESTGRYANNTIILMELVTGKKLSIAPHLIVADIIDTKKASFLNSQCECCRLYLDCSMDNKLGVFLKFDIPSCKKFLIDDLRLGE